MQRDEHGGNIYTGVNIQLDFSISTNPLGLPEPVKQAIVQNISAYSRYPDPACSELRAQLAARNGLSVPMVLCGNGASELIFALCACLKPRHALVLAPTFSEYARTATLFGAEIHQYYLKAEDGFALTRDVLTTLMPELDMVFLCNPNNPTGQLIQPALLEEILQICRKNGTLVLLDECFIEFTREKSLLSSLKDYPNLLILQAFTKIYAMAGLRLGMLYCADENLLLHISEYLPTWNVSSVAQAAGCAALTVGDGWAESTRLVIEAERAFMQNALNDLNFTVFPSDANFLLVKGQRTLYAPLKACGILVRCCANFTGLDETYMRVGLKTREENTALLRAISQVNHG